MPVVGMVTKGMVTKGMAAKRIVLFVPVVGMPTKGMVTKGGVLFGASDWRRLVKVLHVGLYV